MVEHPIPEQLRRLVVSDLVSRVAELGLDRPEGAQRTVELLRMLPLIPSGTELIISWHSNSGPSEGAQFQLTDECLTLTISDEEGSDEVYRCDANSYPDMEASSLESWISYFNALAAPEVTIELWESNAEEHEDVEESYVSCHVPHTDLGLIIRAAAFAAEKHREQRRKDVGASPYINHPLMLADILVNEAGVEDAVTIAAALLHDTLEDTATTLGEIEQFFGPEISDVVAEVTDDKSLPKAERKAHQVASAPKKSDRAKLVKLADKISNLRDIVESPPHDWSEERKQAYFDWARDVIAGCRGVHPKLEAAFDAAYRLRS